MTNENKPKELDEKTLEAAAGGKPEHVFVPDIDKTRGDHKAAGGLTEGGGCGGGIDNPLDDIQLEQVRGGVGKPDIGKEEDKTGTRGERAELPWV